MNRNSTINGYTCKRPGDGDRLGGNGGKPSRLGDPTGDAANGGTGCDMELKNLLGEIEAKLIEAARRRFTGEIRLIFNVSQGGFSTSFIEQERESLVKKRK